MVTFNTDMAVPLKKLKVSVEPVQDLHGYDHPWPAGGGKNKLEVTSTSTTRNGVTITVNSDGTISLSGTATDQVIFGVGSVALSGEYILSGCPSGGNYSTYFLFCVNYDYGSGATVTFDGTRKDIQIYVRSGVNTNGLVFKPMIRLASETDATFAPYSNICPITGWDGVKVTRTGKNLIDAASGGRNAQNWWIGSNASAGAPDGSLVLSAGTYTLSVSEAMTGIYLRKNGNTTSAYNKTQLTFSLAEKTAIKITLYKANVTTDYWGTIDILLKLGSTATDYETYRGNTYDITLPTEAGTVYGGTLDAATGELVVDRAIIQLNGTEGWRTLGSIGSDRRYDAYISKLPGVAVGSWVSDTFRLGSSPSGTDNLFGTYYFYSTTNLCINDKEGKFSTLADFTAWLAENTPSFVANLATPITYTLTASQIRTLLGQNNIWSDAGQVELSYWTHTSS